jgi:acetate kinase
VLNSGSSTQKACVYDIGETIPDRPPACLWEGRIEWRGETASTETNANGAAQKSEVTISSRDQVLRGVLSTLWSGNTRVVASSSDIDAVGHRIVHGGSRLRDPIGITPEVYSTIAGMVLLRHCTSGPS